MNKSGLINRFDKNEDEDTTVNVVQFGGRKMRLEEYAKWKKDHYMITDMKAELEEIKKKKKQELEEKRNKGIICFSDSEIERKINDEIGDLDNLLPVRLYDPKKRNNHKQSYIFENGFHSVDLHESLEKIRYKATETFLIIVFSHHEIIGEIRKETKSDDYIEPSETQAAMREVFLKYPNADSIIMAHNHPHHIVAEPSEEDRVRTLHTRIALKYFEIKLLDSLVVTDVDTFSILQMQKEEKNWKERFQKDLDQSQNLCKN